MLDFIFILFWKISGLSLVLFIAALISWEALAPDGGPAWWKPYRKLHNQIGIVFCTSTILFPILNILLWILFTNWT